MRFGHAPASPRLRSNAVENALVGGLVGLMAALWTVALDRRSRARKAVAAAARMRSAIAADMDILKQLPPDSPAAAQLNAVLEQRLKAYLGRPPLRLGNAAVVLTVLAAAVVWMAWSLANAAAPGDYAVYGSGMGFFGGMLVQVALSVLLVWLSSRRNTAAEASPAANGEPPAGQQATA